MKVFVIVAAIFLVFYASTPTGLKCYLCDSEDDDYCVIDAASSGRVATCPPYQYCSVVRRETKFNETTTRVKISRGCMSYELESVLKEDRIEGVETSVQTCTTNYCNNGDGRLKCYSCQGNGTDSCVASPEKSAKQVTCPAYQNCHTLRREVTIDNSTQVFVNVTRGCRPVDYIPEDSKEDDDDNEKLFAQSCSMDLCNTGLDKEVDMSAIVESSFVNLNESLNSTDWNSTDSWNATETADFFESADDDFEGLQCYFCEGRDYDSCVAGNDGQRLNCESDEECNVLRKHTNFDRSGDVLVEVWRGCKPKNYTFEFDDDPKVAFYTQSCTDSLCNVGLSQDLTTSGATGNGKTGSPGFLMLASFISFIFIRF